jgi:Holliday junction resolvase RusA-like endonuclease
MDSLERIVERQAFLCPIAPSTNNLYDNTPHGRRKSTGYRKWLIEAGWRVREQQVKAVPGTRWGLTIAAPINMKRDISNVIKATEDLIVELQLIPDDRFIDDIHVVRLTEGKEMYVTLRSLA